MVRATTTAVPKSDWECGNCHTANYGQRTECHRCRQPYNPGDGSHEIPPCNEVMVRCLPLGTTEGALVKSFRGIVPSLGEILSVRIIPPNASVVPGSVAGNRGDNSAGGTAYVRFASIDDAQRMVERSGGKLFLGDAAKNSAPSRVSYSLSALRLQEEVEKHATMIQQKQLAKQQSHQAWEFKPPAIESEAQLKEFLTDMYQRYDTLTPPERRYYDEQAMLLIQKNNAPVVVPVTAALSPPKPFEDPPVSNVNAPSNNSSATSASAIMSLKEKLAAKKAELLASKLLVKETSQSVLPPTATVSNVLEGQPRSLAAVLGALHSVNDAGVATSAMFGSLPLPAEVSRLKVLPRKVLEIVLENISIDIALRCGITS